MPPNAKGVIELIGRMSCFALEMTLLTYSSQTWKPTLCAFQMVELRKEHLRISACLVGLGVSPETELKGQRGKRSSRRTQYKVGRKEFWQSTAIREQGARGKALEQWLPEIVGREKAT